MIFRYPISEYDCLFNGYFDKCKEVFPYETKNGFNIMDNEKNHSIKHGGNNIAKYGDLLNMSCETPEDAHRFCIKGPGGCTNQGPEAALTICRLCCSGAESVTETIKKMKNAK